MPASHQDATGAALLSRVMYWWNGTSAVPANETTPVPVSYVDPAPGTGSITTLLNGVTATGAGAVAALPRGSFPRVISAKVVGTGAVSATVLIYGRAGSGGTNLLMTFTLSGTTSDNDGAALEAPWPEIWADVTAISGTGAAVTVTTGY